MFTLSARFASIVQALLKSKCSVDSLHKMIDAVVDESKLMEVPSKSPLKSQPRSKPNKPQRVDKVGQLCSLIGELQQKQQKGEEFEWEIGQFAKLKQCWQSASKWVEGKEKTAYLDEVVKLLQDGDPSEEQFIAVAQRVAIKKKVQKKEE